jgi:Protein of unknown function DUF262
MKYKIEKWSIEKLVDYVNNDKIVLKPPFQRNFVWGEDDQVELIESIKNGYPLPTFFIYQKGDELFDMIDGQQRTRTIIKFLDLKITDKIGNKYSEALFPQFKNYELPIAVITELEETDSLEIFYTRVNKLGKRLNRPELNKAEFINTKFLKLVEELTQVEDFKKLDLFRKLTIVRMNDRDFVEEIVSLIKFGFTDKKLTVDKLFRIDITDEEYQIFKDKFLGVLSKIILLDEIYKINKTRYRQKNDFYTLFSFIYLNNEIEQSILNIFYKIMIIIGPEISPSNEISECLREYAINCVSQSNSKDAREKRYNIFKDLLLNHSNIPNSVQTDIYNYFNEKYHLTDLDYVNVNGFYTFNWVKLNSALNLIHSDGT